VSAAKRYSTEHYLEGNRTSHTTAEAKWTIGNKRELANETGALQISR
jgi:hypothetical protein